MSDKDEIDAFWNELVSIEKRILPFNIFEALDIQRRELSHSKFLACLLDPHGNHGLGDMFLREFLQQVAAAADDVPFPNVTELNSWSYEHVTTKREWQHIDILVTDLTNRFVCIIENKIDSMQHSNQLNRYYDLVCRLYPKSRWRFVTGIYLTPLGAPSGHRAYRSISYEAICKALDQVLCGRAFGLDNSAVVALRQYKTMLRRHIVNDETLAKYCRDIYRRHKRAIDLIYRYHRDQQDVLRDLLRNLIEQEDSPFAFNYEPSNKSFIMVTVKQWNDYPKLHPSDNEWLLVLVFSFVADGIDVALQLTKQKGDIRQDILALVRDNYEIFQQAMPKDEDWANLYRQPFFHLAAYQDASEDELAAALKEQWHQFIDGDFRTISDLVIKQRWLQPSGPSTSLRSSQAE